MCGVERTAYREFAPSPSVSEVVARFWCLTAPDGLEPNHIHKRDL